MQMVQSTVRTHAIRMAYEEFLRWKDEDTHAEWVDGEVILTMPPKDRHQDIVLFLASLLRILLDLTGTGKVRTAPLEVYLPGRPASREPDIVVVLGENLRHLSEDRFTGAPDLLVEVISEDSVRRDRVEKFLEYEREGCASTGSSTRALLTMMWRLLRWKPPSTRRLESTTRAGCRAWFCPAFV
jgi:Uma2 family endonuclease